MNGSQVFVREIISRLAHVGRIISLLFKGQFGKECHCWTRSVTKSGFGVVPLFRLLIFCWDPQQFNYGEDNYGAYGGGFHDESFRQDDEPVSIPIVGTS